MGMEMEMDMAGIEHPAKVEKSGSKHGSEFFICAPSFPFLIS
jgi:hypothetical protein